MHPIQGLKGLTPAKAKQFEKKGITTIEELLEFFPNYYYDFLKTTAVRDLEIGTHAAVKAQITELHPGAKCNSYTVKDENGNTMRVVWFGTTYHYSMFSRGQTIYFAGRVGFFNQLQITNPILISTNPKDVLQITPVYSKIKGMADKYLHNSIETAINTSKGWHKNPNQEALAQELALVETPIALEGMHHPESIRALKAGKKRTNFNKLWNFYEALFAKSSATLAEHIQGNLKTEVREQFVATRLPYELTEGQQYAIQQTTAIIQEGKRLNALVSGDVGCGKTIVAIISALTMAENGYQTVVLAPTLVLASQHIKEFSSMLEGIEVNGRPASVQFVTGKTTKRERKRISEALSNHQVDILVGTHAVLSDDFTFDNLGLVIVDEEHKFGVIQKDKLRLKSQDVHYMAMTATPIPRSIAMSLYGRDTIILPIKTMPQGRKPTITKQYFDLEETFEAVLDEVDKGFQAYLIAPLIEKSESEKMAGVMSVEELEEAFQAFLNKKLQETGKVYTKASINGKMSEAEVLAGISDFASGSANVLISTTIVEVGVNVPNATVICITSAERFGLSALHQLRGRVGRGGDQGYCLLYSERRSERLDIICAETNGYKIAEEDLRLRGPGDLIGEEQKGMSEIVDLIVADPQTAHKVKDYLENLSAERSKLPWECQKDM